MTERKTRFATDHINVLHTRLRAGVVTMGCAALVVGVAACSSSGGGTTTPTTGQTAAGSPAPAGSTAAGGGSATAAGGDLKSRLITATDIPIDGFSVLSSGAAPGGVDGATVVFADKAKTRTVTDVVAKLPSGDAAATAAKAAVSSASGQFTGAKTKAVSIGDGGTQISGTASGAANTVVVFTKGSYFVTMSFASAANDPVPEALVDQVAKTQADKLG